MLTITETIPSGRPREFATTELPADAHAIAVALSAQYPEFVYAITGEWNGEQFTVRYQDGHKLPALTEEEHEREQERAQIEHDRWIASEE